MQNWHVSKDITRLFGGPHAKCPSEWPQHSAAHTVHIWCVEQQSFGVRRGWFKQVTVTCRNDMVSFKIFPFGLNALPPVVRQLLVDHIMELCPQNLTHQVNQSILQLWDWSKDLSPDLALQQRKEPEINWCQIRGVGWMRDFFHISLHHCSDSVIGSVARCVVVQDSEGLVTPQCRSLALDCLMQTGQYSHIDFWGDCHLWRQELRMHNPLIIKENLHEHFLCLPGAQHFFGPKTAFFKPLHALGFLLQLQHTEPAVITRDDTPQEQRILAFLQILPAEMHMQLLLFLCEHARHKLGWFLPQLQVLLQNLVHTPSWDLGLSRQLANCCPPVDIQNSLDSMHIWQSSWRRLLTRARQVLSRIVSHLCMQKPASASQSGESIFPIDNSQQIKSFLLTLALFDTRNDVKSLCTAHLHGCIVHCFLHCQPWTLLKCSCLQTDWVILWTHFDCLGAQKHVHRCQAWPTLQWSCQHL